MAKPAFRKYPTEIRTLTFYFSEKLASGDTLSGLPTVTGSVGLTLTGATIDTAASTVSVHVGGGTAGNDYEVRCEVNTTSGDLLKEAATIEVRDDAN